MVKQPFAAICSLRATNSHWLNEVADGYKNLNIFKYRLFSLSSSLISIMVDQFGF